MRITVGQKHAVRGSSEVKSIDVAEFADIKARRMRVYPGGVGRTTGYLGEPAPTLVRGEGYYVWDSDGDRKIDLSNNFTALVHGHAHPEVTAAAVRALENGASFGLPNPDEVRHAEVLLDRVPWCDHVRYTNSGTEAMMTAVRIARAATGRDKILGLLPSYHGTGDSLLPMTGNIRGVPRGVTNDVLLMAPNDVGGMANAFTEHDGEIAAVVLDLMPAAAGGQPLKPDFVASVASLARQYGALLIVDEVISFRIAVQGFADSHYDLQPDLLVTGKVIGGGLPIGVVLGTREVMAVLDPPHPRSIDHGGTFSGNPVSMSAGIAAMELFTGDEVARLNKLGDRLREGLRVGGASWGWDVNGYGSVVRLVSTGPDPVAHLRQLFWTAFADGVSLSPTGTVAISTPMDEGVVDTLIDRVTSCFAECAG